MFLLDFKMQNIYNLNLIISLHFDDLIQKVDIITENLLAFIIKTSKDENSIRETNQINDQRNSLIEKIIEVREFKLISIVGVQSLFERKWKLTIENSSISDESKIDLFKSDFIKMDCFLREDSGFVLGLSMWITNKYIGTRDKTFFEYFEPDNNFKINPQKHDLIEIECIDKDFITNFCLLNEIKSKDPSLIQDLTSVNVKTIQRLKFSIFQYGFKILTFASSNRDTCN